MKWHVHVLFLVCCAPAHAITIDIYSGLPGNAGTGAAPLDFSGSTLAGTFTSSDINFGTSNQLWDPLGITSNYGADITASIDVAADGTYNFNTSSDDGSLLFIDGQLVVNNNYYQGFNERTGSIHLSAGVHTLEIQYFQGGGGNALASTLPAGVTYANQVPPLMLNIYQYSGFLMPKPNGEVPAPVTPPGAKLVGSIPTYGANFGIPNYDWTPFGLSGNFTADLQGYFLIPTTGSYTFNTGSDDGSYLFIDGQMVVENGFYQGYTVRSGTVNLSAGLHPFELEYFQGGGGAALSMGVPNGVLMEPIPEPGTIALGGAALAALLWRRYRSRVATY